MKHGILHFIASILSLLVIVFIAKTCSAKLGYAESSWSSTAKKSPFPGPRAKSSRLPLNLFLSENKKPLSVSESHVPRATYFAALYL